jgi:hypothetical protein
MVKKIGPILCVLIFIALGGIIYQYTIRYINENKILKQIVSRLQADSRIAEVLVTEVRYDEKIGINFTTIKFLEYSTQGKPLPACYFTFPGNIIQFQSLVIRFEDIYIRKKDLFRGKSAYLFWKVFMLDGKNTVEYEITKVNEIPEGYRVKKDNQPFEKKLWRKFWKYALDPKQAKKMGIKNAQIEAPGTVFVPGTLYIIKIEHDGGMRIDVSPLPDILKGERIPR